MDIKIETEINNPIFKRKEISFIINHEGMSTPKLCEVRQEIELKYLVNEGTVFVKKLFSFTGMNKTQGIAEIYDTKERASMIVPKYIQNRNFKEVKKNEQK